MRFRLWPLTHLDRFRSYLGLIGGGKVFAASYGGVIAALTLAVRHGTAYADAAPSAPTTTLPGSMSDS
jgi:hypothetical protein